MSKIKELNKNITKCKKCKRLVDFREKIAKQKRKQYLKETYWGKPVSGFGDINAEILLIGLAPAAHGGNRTGRAFTGDKSSEFLYNCLYSANLSNQPNSDHINDGLVLRNTYISLVLKCVPPNDKPTSSELLNCFNYLEKEIIFLKNVRIIVALGKIAFDSCVKLLNLKKSEFNFVHGKVYKISKEIKLIACYHPSPRNVNTKKINKNMMVDLLNSLYIQMKVETTS